MIEIGEFNTRGQLRGKGLRIAPDGEIMIGWWCDNWPDSGNFFRAYPDGNFNVGKFYTEGPFKRYQGTKYRGDGSTEPWNR